MALTEKDFIKGCFSLVGHAGFASANDILCAYIARIKAKMDEDELPLDYLFDEIEFGSFLNKTYLPCAVLYNPEHPGYMRTCMYVILNGNKYTIRGAQLSYTAKIKGYPMQKKGLSIGKALLSNSLLDNLGEIVNDFVGGTVIERQDRNVWELYFTKYFENIDELD